MNQYHDPFRLTRPGKQAELTRSERLELFHSAVAALARGEMPAPEAAIFLGAAGVAWLEDGGSFERDHLRLTAPRGSHHTIDAFWRHYKSLMGDEDI